MKLENQALGDTASNYDERKTTKQKEGQTQNFKRRSKTPGVIIILQIDPKST